MRVLAVDVENRHTTIGEVTDGEVTSVWRVSSAARTSDELGLVLDNLVAASGIDMAALSSVVPALSGPMKAALEARIGRVVVAGPGLKTGLAMFVDNPREVGTDRVVNAIAAVANHGAPVIVVDFRTATTIDAIDADRGFRGGIIAAGLEVSADALADAAASLRHVELVKPPRVVGKNTVEAIQSGIVSGAAAMVDGLVDRIIAELDLPDDTMVVATGRLAAAVATASRSIRLVDPMLTLTGLWLLAERNPI